MGRRMDYTAYVNIKQGTFSEHRYSYGNTLPLVTAPFGMNAFCLQTKGEAEGWYYHPSHMQTEGIRLTHQPSPWVRDYGYFVFMPQSGEVSIKEGERCSGFQELDMNPAGMEIYLKRYQARIGIAPSERGAAAEIIWDTDKTPRLAVCPADFTAGAELDTEKQELTGWVNAYGDGTRKDFKLYFYMKFNRPIDAEKTVITKSSGEMEKGTAGEGAGVGINIAFAMRKGETLQITLGTSFISSKLAKISAEREISSKTYSEIKEETKKKWNELLSKIEITDTEEKKKTFYSCMYRCFLFPHIFYEYDTEGKAVHYSTKSGKTEAGMMYTDNGFWDTFRTLYPLYGLLIPDKLKEMLEGYLNFYQEEGWLPKWISPGERGIMPGTLIDVVLADAAVKGLLTQKQMELALEGMLKNATTASGTYLNGRIGVLDYVEKGYVPADKYRESINNSLDAYYCDYGISQVARLLGKEELAGEYEKRSQNYRLLFDEKAGFLRGRNADGSRPDSFSPIVWGEGYCEGAAWQNGFAVQYDVEGLASLYGGKEQLAQKLDELFATPPAYEVGSYPGEIHEMTEMANADFGQCAISNQPSFHIPYLYAAIGEKEKTAYWVSRMVQEAFNSTEKGFPGDEDNGSMGAWYVFGVLGIYPLCPGKAEYVTGICNAKEIKVSLGNGRKLLIKNERYGLADYTGMKILVDGKELTSSVIGHEALLSAETITFC